MKKLDTSLRISEAEDLLSSGVTPKRARRILGKRWEISARQAGNYVAAVFKQWEIESRDGRQAKRDQMRARLQMMWRKAMTRKGIYVTKRDEKIEYDNPDIAGGAKILELECRLDGLLEQPDVERHVHLNLASPDVRDGVRAIFGFAIPSPDDRDQKQLPKGAVVIDEEKQPRDGDADDADTGDQA